MFSFTIPSSVKCRKFKKNIKLDATPVINSLSLYKSAFHKPATVYIYGENFLPNGNTSMEFGNIPTPINYISSTILSFDVPFVEFPGTYYIVINNYISLKALNVTGISKTIVLESNSEPFLVYDE
jgi:hypothetical protein